MDRSFVDFIVAYDNYQIEDSNLLRMVVKMYTHIVNGENNLANEMYNQFITKMQLDQLDGTEDLVAPVHQMMGERSVPKNLILHKKR